MSRGRRRRDLPGSAAGELATVSSTSASSTGSTNGTAPPAFLPPSAVPPATVPAPQPDASPPAPAAAESFGVLGAPQGTTSRARAAAAEDTNGHANGHAAPPPSPPAASSPASPPSSEGAPPGAAFPPPAAQAVNDYRNRFARTSQNQWGTGRGSRPMPQAESHLVHVWVDTIVTRQIPAYACTIWMTRQEPRPILEFHIPGEAVQGSGTTTPDVALFEHVQAIANARRQPGIAERYTGRIRAQTADGQILELGGGELYLPPMPTQQQQAMPPWGMQGGAPPWGGMQGAPPWGGAPQGPPGWGAPPWGGSPPGWGMGPPGWNAMPPWWAMMGMQPQAPAPPAAVQNDPGLLELWKMMQANQQAMFSHSTSSQDRMMTLLLERAFSDKTPKTESMQIFDAAEKLLLLTERLGGGRDEGGGGGIHMHKLDDGTLLVEDGKGRIDERTSLGLNIIREGKEMLRQRADARQAQTTLGSPQGLKGKK